ncbi:LOW QUALITY PROTEIN: GTPase IMAP family member 8-like [Rhynchonycteris naso]
MYVGKHGAGKSATGNTILSKDVSTSKFSEQTVTTMCQIEPGETVVVIDTPNHFSSTIRAKDKQRIECCLSLSTPSLDSLEAIEGNQKMFGGGAMRHTIIIFTQKDELGDDSMQDYFESDNLVKESLETCRSQYCAFNNKAEGAERHSQVTELLSQVKRLVYENGGPYRVDVRTEGSGFQDFVKETTSQKGDNPHDLPCRDEVTAHLVCILNDANSVTIPPAGPGEQQLRASDSELNPGTELKVLLVGWRGVGKCTAGSRLLGKRAFETKFSDGMTGEFKSESRGWKGRDDLIIDSPDLSMNSKSALQKHAPQGPHAFLLVTPLGSFSENGEAVLSTLRRFGEKFRERTVVLLTRKEDRGDEEADPLSETTGTVKELIKEAQPVIKEVQDSRGMVDEQDVVVVDTPALRLMLSAEVNPSQLKKFLNYVSNRGGNTVLVLVLKVGWFTQQDEEAVAMLERIVGKDVTESMIVLFTGKKDLGGGYLKDYCDNPDSKALKKIIRKWGGGRVCAFNNKETGLASKDQVTDLLEKAKELIGNRDGHGYFCTQETASKRAKDVQEK